MLLLSDFSLRSPRHRIAQGQALEWLARAHAQAQATGSGEPPEDLLEGMTRRFERFGCSPEQVSSRGLAVGDLNGTDWSRSRIYDVSQFPHGQGTSARSELFAEVVNDYFETEFPSSGDAPSDLIHVTCTGYVSPSGAQRVVARNAWGQRTRVTHAYHMGCYAAFPAIRMAAGQLSTGGVRSVIAHTELCSLHLDPSDHSAEQCVIQSLFGDGFASYAVTHDTTRAGLEVLALDECILSGSESSMRWVAGDHGMRMTLGRDVPERIGQELRGFVERVFRSAGLDVARELRDARVAVHPGGPKIIDAVRTVLELSETQVAASRAVLFEHGNMSSATLPHVWQRMLADEAVASGTLILSLAFGPGLTICGGVFRKR